MPQHSCRCASSATQKTAGQGLSRLAAEPVIQPGLNGQKTMKSPAFFVRRNKSLRLTLGKRVLETFNRLSYQKVVLSCLATNPSYRAAWAWNRSKAAK